MAPLLQALFSNCCSIFWEIGNYSFTTHRRSRIRHWPVTEPRVVCLGKNLSPGITIPTCFKYNWWVFQFYLFQFQYYSYAYSYQMPPGIRKTVEKHFNCEDIALSFLVADTIHKLPILVRLKLIYPYLTTNQSIGGDWIQISLELAGTFGVPESRFPFIRSTEPIHPTKGWICIFASNANKNT